MLGWGPSFPNFRYAIDPIPSCLLPYIATLVELTAAQDILLSCCCFASGFKPRGIRCSRHRRRAGMGPFRRRRRAASRRHRCCSGCEQPQGRRCRRRRLPQQQGVTAAWPRGRRGPPCRLGRSDGCRPPVSEQGDRGPGPQVGLGGKPLVVPRVKCR